MNLVRETIVGFICGLLVYALVIEGFGIFFSGDALSYSLGLLIGVVASVLLFLHMAWTLDRAMDYPEAGATRYVRFRTFLRLALMVAVMLIGVFSKQINFVSLVLGLLGLKIGALIAPFFLRRLYPEHFITDEETLSRVIEDDEDDEDNELQPNDVKS